LASAAVAAEDPRVSFLVKQLATAKDPRVRSQTVLLLGQTASEAAVEPLCTVLKDADPLVRSAAANALGDLRLAAATECLKKALGELDNSVRGELEQAISRGAVANGVLYVNLEPVQDKVGGLAESLVQLADKVLREKLAGGFSAAFAPANEDKKTAATLVKTRNLRAFQLRLQLLPGATEKGLKVEMLVLTYPEQSLKGSYSVKAAGGKPESLIKAMVPRVLEDAAAELEWKP
jgi:hypothetical protein